MDRDASKVADLIRSLGELDGRDTTALVALLSSLAKHEYDVPAAIANLGE